MRDDSGEREQQRNVHRINPVFLELVARVVGAVNRGHEVRIIREQRKKIECHAPAAPVGVRKIKSREQEWR